MKHIWLWARWAFLFWNHCNTKSVRCNAELRLHNAGTHAPGRPRSLLHKVRNCSAYCGFLVCCLLHEGIKSPPTSSSSVVCSDSFMQRSGCKYSIGIFKCLEEYFSALVNFSWLVCFTPNKASDTIHHLTEFLNSHLSRKGDTSSLPNCTFAALRNKNDSMCADAQKLWGAAQVFFWKQQWQGSELVFQAVLFFLANFDQGARSPKSSPAVRSRL